MKRVARFLLMMAALFAPAYPQEAKQANPPKLIRLQHVTAKKVLNLLGPTGYSSNIAHDGDLLILNGSPEVVALLENLIRQIDGARRKRDIEVQAYMLLGVNEPGEGKVSPELAGVVKQLKETFPFAGYRQIETLLLRAGEGRPAEASGLMPGPGGVSDASPKATYRCEFSAATIEEEEGGVRRISFTHLRFGTKIPVSTGKETHQYADLGANIDSVTIREGQKAVIGKAGTGPGKESLFLVLSAKVVE